MARGRFLSKSISTNERFTRVSDRARVLWLMALPHADVDGLLPGSRGELGATAVPSLLLTFQWTIPDVQAARDELVAAGLWLLRADAFDREVVEVCRFHDHQTLQTDKEGKSRYVKKRVTPESTPDLTPESTLDPTLELGGSRGDAQVKVSKGKTSEEKSSEPTRVRKSKDDAGLPPEFDGCRWAPDEIEAAFSKSYGEEMKRPLRVNRKDREEFLLRPCPELQPVDDLGGFFTDAIRALKAKDLAVTLRSCVNALSWVPLRSDTAPNPEDVHPMFRKAVSPFAPKAD